MNPAKSKKSPTVLVHSAAGGVGLFACDIVEGLGGAAIATVGSEGKVDFLMNRQDGTDMYSISLSAKEVQGDTIGLGPRLG